MVQTQVYAADIFPSVFVRNDFTVGTASGSYTGSTTIFNLNTAYQTGSNALYVYNDGVLMTITADYGETNSTTVTFNTARTVGSKMTFITLVAATAASAVTNVREDYIAGTASGNYTGSLTLFNLLNSYVVDGKHLQVFVDGVLQIPAGDYTETSSTSITFASALTTGQNVTFVFAQSAASYNAQSVNGISASSTPSANQLYPLNSSAQLPSSVVDAFSNTFVGIGRNRWINGEMGIDQVNGGVSVSVTGATKTSVDQIISDSSGSPGVFSLQRLSATPPTGFGNYLRATVTTPDASLTGSKYYRFYYAMEGYLTRDWNFGASAAKTLTMSFWVRSSLTGTFTFGMLNGNVTRSFIGTYVINNTNTWEYKTVVIVGDTTGTWNSLFTSANAYWFFNLGSGPTYQNTPGSWFTGQGWSTSTATNLIATNGATFDITGIQLEVGTAATPFEYRPYGVELMFCQRYYYKTYSRDINPGSAVDPGKISWSGSTDTSQQFQMWFKWPVNMRAAPSVTFYTPGGTSGNWTYNRSGSSGNATMAAGGGLSESGMNFATQALGVTYVPVTVEGHIVADARLS